MVENFPNLLQGLAFSPEQRRDLNVNGGYVDRNYIDDYQNAVIAQNNLEANWWMWQQQQKYNSPAAQVERLKAAGINPNAGIDGAGNMSSIPQSSGSINSNVVSNQQKNFQNGVSLVNSLISSIGEGITDLGKYSELPPLALLPYYKQLGVTALENSNMAKEASAFGKNIDSLTNMIYDLGIDPMDVNPELYEKNGILPTDLNVRESNKSKLIQSVIELRTKQKEVMDSNISNNQKRGKLLENQTKFVEQNLDWLPWEKGVDLGTKVTETVLDVGTGIVGAKLKSAKYKKLLKKIK